MDPKTSVSYAPHPRPWKTRAPMLPAKLVLVVMFQMVPMKIKTKETKYTGRLPNILDAIKLRRPVKADRIRGTAVRATTEE